DVQAPEKRSLKARLDFTDHLFMAKPEPSLEQVEVLLSRVECIPLNEHGRVDDQPRLCSCSLDIGERRGPQQEMETLQIGVRPKLWSDEREIEGAAEPTVQLTDEFQRQQVVFSTGFHALWADEIQ